MRCPYCKKDIADESNYCYFCGARQEHTAAAGAPPRRLMRSSTDVKVAGVCAGFAEYLDWDPTIVRLVWVVVGIFTGIFPALIAYGVGWAIMPVAPRPTPMAAPTTDAGAQPLRT
jgi:phage shock protein C